MISRSQIGYLQHCCNRYGDFQVALARQRNNQIAWSKWRSVLECWESQQGINFLGTVNNRTSFECEIVLDLDDNISAETLSKMCKVLDHYSFNYKTYFSGSKSYHVHVIVPELGLENKQLRQKLRLFLLKKTSCDLQLANERHMIALEHSPHWKTGKMKTAIKTTK